MTTRSAPERLIGTSTQIACWFSSAALAFMTLAIVADVCARNFFNFPLKGSVEIAEITLVIAVTLALPQSFFDSDHIVVDLVDDLTSASFADVLKLVGALLTTLLLILFCVFMVGPMKDAFQFHDVLLETGFAMGWLWAIFWLSLIHSTIVMIWVTTKLLAPVWRMIR